MSQAVKIFLVFPFDTRTLPGKNVQNGPNAKYRLL